MEIKYLDKNIVVCIKPVGMDSQKAVPEELIKQIGGDIFTVHRLDLNVGGVMVYARNKKSAAMLSRAINEGTMVKEYIALVHGITPDQGDWEDLLWKDAKKNKVYVVKRMRGGVKKARLEFECKEHREDQSLVHIRLYTGRTHQIRVQFASRGYPLVGDHKYGSKAKQMNPSLFSCRLSFPYKNQMLCFEAYPEWM